MEYEIRTVVLEEQPTLAIRASARPQDVGPILVRELPRIARFIAEKGGKISGAPFTRDLAVNDGVYDFEAGFPVAFPMDGREEILSSKLDAGKFAMTSHFGPYELLPQAHKALVAWMRGRNLPISFPIWDQYISDPTSTPPEQVETQIFYPINIID